MLACPRGLDRGVQRQQADVFILAARHFDGAVHHREVALQHAVQDRLHLPPDLLPLPGQKPVGLLLLAGIRQFHGPARDRAERGVDARTGLDLCPPLGRCKRAELLDMPAMRLASAGQGGLDFFPDGGILRQQVFPQVALHAQFFGSERLGQFDTPGLVVDQPVQVRQIHQQQADPTADIATSTAKAAASLILIVRRIFRGPSRTGGCRQNWRAKRHRSARDQAG